jgi:Mg2+ and Co2+ transporter CorA
MTNAWDSGFVLATASLIVFAVAAMAWFLRRP